MNRKQTPIGVDPSLQVKCQRDCNTVLFNIFLFYCAWDTLNTAVSREKVFGFS